MNHLGDTNKMVSDTPRTDAHNWHDGDYDDPLHAFADFAKQLERELNEWKRWCKEKEQALDDLAKVFSQQQDRIKRLEEAGDALYENSDPTKWDLPEANARKLKEQEAWRKAKEDKP